MTGRDWGTRNAIRAAAAASALALSACGGGPFPITRRAVFTPGPPDPVVARPPDPLPRSPDWPGPDKSAILERTSAYRRRMAEERPVEPLAADPSALEARLVLDPDDLSARRALLRHWVIVGRPDRARGQAPELCRRHPGAPTLPVDLQTVLREAPDLFEDLADVMRSASARMPSDPGVAYNCGRLFDLHGPPRRLDAGDEGLFHYRRAAGLAPGRALFRERLALRLHAAALLEEAVEHYRAAAGLWEAGHRGDALAGLAEVSLLRGEFRAAHDAAREALADDAAGPERGGHVTNRAHTLMGLVALEMKKPEIALRHLGAAADVRPCPHTAAEGLDLRLAESLAARGHAAAARRYARLAVLFRPDDPAAASLLRRTAEREKRIENGHDPFG